MVLLSAFEHMNLSVTYKSLLEEIDKFKCRRDKYYLNYVAKEIAF